MADILEGASSDDLDLFERKARGDERLLSRIHAERERRQRLGVPGFRGGEGDGGAGRGAPESPEADVNELLRAEVRRQRRVRLD
ncbi:MAG: hypothetical protein R6W48_04450, partial [Gaiellaceae bacterium]